MDFGMTATHRRELKTLFPSEAMDEPSFIAPLHERDLKG